MATLNGFDNKAFNSKRSVTGNASCFHPNKNMTSYKKKCSMQKSVRQLVELPPTCGSVYCHSVASGSCSQGHSRNSPAGSSQCQNVPPDVDAKKYAEPQLNSVMRTLCQMETLRTKQPKKFKSPGDLTPRSKAAIAPKVTQKLNFPVNRTVFKNLTPINVNDSILLPEKTTSIRKKYTKSSKAPAPELRDFLDPLPSPSFVIPEPDITLEFPQRSVDPLSSYFSLIN